MQRLVAAREADAFEVRDIHPLQTLRWLRAGWRDFTRCPLPGLLHGAACALFGALLLAFAHDRFWLLSGAFSGFLIVAPILATGLYRVSQRLESDPSLGQREGLRAALDIWRPRDGRLIVFGLLLGFAGTGWVFTSASLVTGFSGQPVRYPLEFIRHVMLHPDSWLFEAWLVLGGVLAAPVFASSVVALPLMLDRPVGVLAAVLVSWRVVLANPVSMALWSGLLLGVSLLGMAAALVGLVVVVPWLAHASWHAYRDLVAAPAVGKA